MNANLIDILRQLPATGTDGFEGLIAELLANLTGRKFYLAKSGFQAGRDLSSMRHLNTNVIAIECKRYGQDTELNERELLGELVQATFSILNLDLWVLVTSRDVDSRLHEALNDRANREGVEFLSISAGDESPSSLEALCAQAPEVVITYVKTQISHQEKSSLRKQLDDIAVSPQFEARVEQLREAFLSSLVGYDNWRAEHNQWLVECLQSEIESRANFGQLLNVGEDGVKLIRRESAWNELDEWFSSWGESRKPFVLLGEEGDGKTWGVASWLSQKIQAVNEFPAVVFLSSTNIDINEPSNLLSKAIARRHSTPKANDFWEKRLNRWTGKPADDIPLLVVVLDGINERRTASWWRELIEKLAASPWRDQIAVIITCRTAYWQRHFDNLRHLQVIKYTISPYNDSELEKALSYHNLRLSDISSNLMSLIRKPRYFDLMVKYRGRISESGNVTVERLIYEDWRDRLERKGHLQDLDDDTFQGFIRDLVSKYQGDRYVKEQDISGMMPTTVDKQVIFEELRTGGILQGRGNRYQVDKNLLIYGFGLLLVDQLEESVANGEREFEEVIADWLEPQAGMDIKAEICGFAALLALELPDLSREAKVALLNTWISSQNPGPEIEENFLAYFPLDPQGYFELAEVVWSDSSENRWAQELLMRSFLRWRKHSKFIPEFCLVFERWLGFVNLYGFVAQRGKTIEDVEKLRQEIYNRIGHEVTPDQTFTFGDYSFIAIEDSGLLRLSRAALAVISHLPRNLFIKAIATGCLAEALMGWTDKYQLFQWILSTSPQSVWAEVEEEVQRLLNVNHIVAKQAAYRLLSFEGSKEAYQLQQTFPDDLFPPYTHFSSQWTQAECETYLQSEGLDPQYAARQLKPLCIDPNLSVPNDIGSRLEPLAKTIPVTLIWSHTAMTEEDHNFETYEPTLCAYAPNAIADLVRCIARQVNDRDKLALRQLAWRSIEHHLILGQEEFNDIHNAWTNLIQKQSDGWTEEQKFAEMYLFRVLLKHLDTEQQITYLLKRPAEFIDLLVYKQSFLPITNWQEVWQKLEGADTQSTRRILWFLSVHPEIIPDEDLREKILPFTDYEDSFVRLHALKILYYSKDEIAIKKFISGSWAWKPVSENEIENHWGSLILCEYGSDLPYSELRCRVHPIYLGYAIKCRGINPEEVKRYAEDIHHIWSHIGTDAPDLPSDFPVAEVEARFVEHKNVTMVNRIGLIQSQFTKSFTFFNRDFTWGGILDESNPEELNEGLTTFGSGNDDQYQTSLQILRETLREQREAGNFWFGQKFHTDALDEVLNHRPDLKEEWLQEAFAERPEARQRLYLGSSFYEALCNRLLHIQPDMGVKLYWRIREVGARVYTQAINSKIRILDYDLFQAPITPKIEEAWNYRVETCKTDQELMEVAMAAQFGNTQDWLWSSIEQGVQSQAPLEKSRSITLLGFVESDEALELLNYLLKDQPDTWLKNLLETSLKRWQMNSWAKHWFRRFLEVDDEVQAWASFRLFLQCVDRRFWHWYEQIKAEIVPHPDLEKRWAFFEDNSETIENKIRKNEKSLRENFLGQKLLKRQVWPWM